MNSLIYNFSYLPNKYSLITYEKPHMSMQLYDELIDHENIHVQCLLASYKNLPIICFDKLLKKDNELIDSFLMLNQYYSSIFLKKGLKNYFNDNYYSNKKFELNSKVIDFLSFDSLLTLNNQYINHIMGEHPLTPSVIIDQLIEENIDNTFVISGIAKNSKINKSQFIQIYNNYKNNIKILEFLSYNVAIPNEIINILAKHENEQIRSNIAYNAKCPYEVRMNLINDDSITVLCKLAYNKNISFEEINILIQHEESIVRESAYWSDNCTEYHYSFGVYDESKNVKKIIAFKTNNIFNLENLAFFHDSEINEQLLYNKNSPAKIIEKIVLNSNDLLIMSLAMSHSNVSLKALEYMILLNNSNLNNTIAFNHKKHIEILEILFKNSSKNNDVIKYLGRNESTPVHILEKIYKQSNPIIDTYLIKNKKLPSKVSLQLIDKYIDNMDILSSAARYSENSEVLLKLALLNIDELYSIIAKNPNTTNEVLFVFPSLYLPIICHHPNYKSVAFNILKNIKKS